MDTYDPGSPAQLMEMVHAFRRSRIILTAAELAVFDLLGDNGITSAEVAAALQTDPRATDRLLNALTAIKLLTKEGLQFRNTAFSSKHLVTSSPGYLGGLGLANQTWKTWSTLTDAVRKGTTVAMDAPINDRPAHWQELFIAAMHARGGQQAAELAEALDLRSVRRMLDVGGGSGAFAFGMIRTNPAISATVFDLPNITPISRRYIASSGFSGQVDTVDGDYLRDPLGSGYDLVLMSAILHINSPDENLLLIKKGTDALNPGGQLVVVDHIMNDDRTLPEAGTFFALNMLVGTFHGDTYTGNEIRTWMNEAGLSDILLDITPSGVQFMTGKKPATA